MKCSVCATDYVCFCDKPIVVGGTDWKDKESKPRAPEILAQGAKTFADRNSIYGDSYRTLGTALSEMLPKGLNIKAGDVAAFQRLGVFMHIVNKCCRYATHLSTGSGHQDSAHDLMVYGALLEELTVNDPT